MRRRRVLQTIGASSLVFASGCIGDDGETESRTDGDDGPSEDSANAGEDGTEIQGFRRWLQPSEPFRYTDFTSPPEDAESPHSWADLEDLDGRITYADSGDYPASFDARIVLGSINEEGVTEVLSDGGYEETGEYRGWKIMESEDLGNIRYISDESYILPESESWGETLIDTYSSDEPRLEEENPVVSDAMQLITQYDHLASGYSYIRDAPHAENITLWLGSSEPIDSVDGAAASNMAIAFDFEITDDEATAFAEETGDFIADDIHDISIHGNIALFEGEYN